MDYGENDLSFTSAEELRQFRNRLNRRFPDSLEVRILDDQRDRVGLSEQDGDTMYPPVVLKSGRHLLKLVGE